MSDWSADVCSSDLVLELPLLSPVHRLDRATAGVLLFCADPESRGAYQALFQTRDVRKEYEALAPVRAPVELPLLRPSLILPRPGPFTKFGRASSRERVCLYFSISVVAYSLKK